MLIKYGGGDNSIIIIIIIICFCFTITVGIAYYLFSQKITSTPAPTDKTNIVGAANTTPDQQITVTPIPTNEQITVTPIPTNGNDQTNASKYAKYSKNYLDNQLAISSTDAANSMDTIIKNSQERQKNVNNENKIASQNAQDAISSQNEINKVFNQINAKKSDDAYKTNEAKNSTLAYQTADINAYNAQQSREAALKKIVEASNAAQISRQQEQIRQINQFNIDEANRSNKVVNDYRASVAAAQAAAEAAAQAIYDARVNTCKNKAKDPNSIQGKAVKKCGDERVDQTCDGGYLTWSWHCNPDNVICDYICNPYEGGD
jgi:hypothetical protein